MGPDALARRLFARAVARVDPAAAVCQALGELQLPGAVLVLALGKAAARMAAGAIEALGSRCAAGLVVAPEPESPPAPLRARVGGHPVANAASERAGRDALALLRAAQPGQTAVVLVSGGASALAAVPVSGLSLAEKSATVRAVMASGAPIAEINAVRKHLSAIKGGRLAEASPVPIVTLVASDVVGDDLSVVGSGPSVPDPSSLEQARQVLERVAEQIAPAVFTAMARAGETPKRARPGDRAILVSGVGVLTEAAAAEGAEVIGRDVIGDVGDVAVWLAEAARAARDVARERGEPVLRVAGGEPTLALGPRIGCGGRAQQLALEVARHIAGLDRVAVLAAGSDGVDGNSSAAGAVVDGQTWALAGPDPVAALRDFDANPALEAADALIVTGPTGVNCADLFVVAAVP